MAEKTIKLSHTQISDLCGNLDENLLLIEKNLSVKIFVRNSDFKITGDPLNIEKCIRVLEGMDSIANKGEPLNAQVINYLISIDEKNDNIEDVISKCICITAKGKPIKAKTMGQSNYVKQIENNTICFGIGPAGTGKTYLAVALAVKALKAKNVSKIILTRPAVEAGEKLGFLPGDLQEKVDPYLRPLYDAIYDMVGAETHAKLVERGTIEVAPLAYMRGRTLDDAFIILDEAQNTTPEQMKMFLTRLGNSSKAVITGDVTQIDLPIGKSSGLIEATKILNDIDDIAICKFSAVDVVRHPLVQKIIVAYEEYEKNE